jgi:anti-anti-sigma factor
MVCLHRVATASEMLMMNFQGLMVRQIAFRRKGGSFMLTAQTTSAWDCEVERGPDWVFVRLCPMSEGGVDEHSLADRIWSILEQSFTYRLVLELDGVELMQSCFIAQLVMLSKRIHSHGGILRLCRLSPVNQQVLHTCRLEGCLPNYDNRSDAVMGGTHRPLQPR